MILILKLFRSPWILLVPFHSPPNIPKVRSNCQGDLQILCTKKVGRKTIVSGVNVRNLPNPPYLKNSYKNFPFFEQIYFHFFPGFPPWHAFQRSLFTRAPRYHSAPGGGVISGRAFHLFPSISALFFPVLMLSKASFLFYSRTVLFSPQTGCRCASPVTSPSLPPWRSMRWVRWITPSGSDSFCPTPCPVMPSRGPRRSPSLPGFYGN